MRLGEIWALSLFLLGLTACAVQSPQSALLASPTPTVTLTPTRTPVWFPPTDTPTPIPTATPVPTLEMRPGVGEVVLTDDFSGANWQTGETEAGRIALGKGELTLAVTAEKGVLTSLRSGVLPGDGYLEITVQASLCRPNDVYGVLVRASSPRDGYRILFNCGGSLRAERLKDGKIALLQDWTPVAGLPSGLLPARLGVWMAGQDLRLFVNDVYQFSLRDPVWAEGSIGAYARAAGASPLTVAFSALEVRALDVSRIPTATPFPSPTP